MAAVSNAFMLNVLARIRAPQSALNVQNLQTWQRFEGGTFAWNPLNTTRPEPGSSPQGGEHDQVQNYPDAATGERATADTLLNGRYTAILVKLWNSAPLTQWNDPSVLEQIETWGTHGFAAYIRTQKPQPTPQPPPIPIPKENDRMLLIAVPNGTVYLLGGNFMIPLSDGATEAAFLNAGIPKVTVDQLMYEHLVAHFPAATPPAPAAA